MERKASLICSECGARVSFPAGASQVQCSHCDAGLVVEQGARLVRLGCPHCGGNFYYIDGTLNGRCPFCDTPLLALTEGRVLRYVVVPEAPRPAEAPAAELLLLPFWHLGGLLYCWTLGSRVELRQDTQASSTEAKGSDEALPRTVRHDSGPMKAFNGRVLDISLADPATSAVGVTSLRYRGGIFPLEPMAEEHERLGRIVSPRLDHASALDRLMARALSLSAPAEGMTRLDLRRVDLAAERLSLYYYPFWVQRAADGSCAAWDAVSGQAEPLSTPIEPPASVPPGIFDKLQVIVMTCGDCGAPLPAGNHAMVIPCEQCRAVWRVTREGLQPFQAHYAEPRQEHRKLVWLPFWHLLSELSYGGQRAGTVADLVRVLGVLRSPSKLPQAAPIAPLGYFVPAYGALRAPRLDHAARDMTRHQPELLPASEPAGERFTCFFGADDAARLAYATWIQIVPGAAPTRMRSLRVDVRRATLWYVPFDDLGRELVNLLTGFRYDWDAFRGVRH